MFNDIWREEEWLLKIREWISNCDLREVRDFLLCVIFSLFSNYYLILYRYIHRIIWNRKGRMLPCRNASCFLTQLHLKSKKQHVVLHPQISSLFITAFHAISTNIASTGRQVCNLKIFKYSYSIINIIMIMKIS